MAAPLGREAFIMERAPLQASGESPFACGAGEELMKDRESY